MRSDAGIALQGLVTQVDICFCRGPVLGTPKQAASYIPLNPVNLANPLSVPECVFWPILMTSDPPAQWEFGSLVGPQTGVGLPNGGSEYIPEVRKSSFRYFCVDLNF